MNPFRTDPEAALKAAQAALSSTMDKILALELQRAAAIEQSETDDYINDVAEIDAELGRLRAGVATHEARVAAMETRCQQQALARREQARQAGIADVGKRLVKRLAAARKLDAAVLQLQRSFGELVKADQAAFGDFPSSVPQLGRLPHFHIDAFPALSARRLPRPPSAGVIRHIAEIELPSFADAIEARNKEVIEMLESAPVEPQDAV